MAYEVRISPAARAGIDLLPPAVAAAAVNLIAGELSKRPEMVGIALTGGLKGNHVAHRGQYRIVYRVDSAKKIVNVLQVMSY